LVDSKVKDFLTTHKLLTIKHFFFSLDEKETKIKTV